METSPFRQLRVSGACFLNFLRGMETLFQERPEERPRHFLNFLRGMETVLVGRPYAGKGCFLNFLRGMETRFRGDAVPHGRKLPKLP